MDKIVSSAVAIVAAYLLSLAAPLPALAAGWTPDLTVGSTFTEGPSDVLVIFTTGGSTYTSGCSANNWVFVADTDPRRARAYATILTALAAGKKVRFWYDDSCGNWSYHRATAVMLVD